MFKKSLRLCIVSGLSVIALTALAVASDKPMTVVYLANWSRLEGADSIQLPAQNIDDLIYAFADVCYPGSTKKECEGTKACHIAFSIPKIDTDNFKAFVDLKKQYPKLKIQYSLGGGDLSYELYHCAKTADSRKALVASLVKFKKQYPVIDGFDFDWEFPVKGGPSSEPHSSDDRQNYLALVTATRKALGPDALLTVALPSGDQKENPISDFPVKKMLPLLDWFNMMSYDYNGVWLSSTDFLAPLYSEGSLDINSNIDGAIQRYEQVGIPANKLVMGVPLYAVGWQTKEKPAPLHGLYQDAGRIKLDDYDTTLSYRHFLQKILRGNKGGKLYWREATKASYYYNPTNGVFYSMESPQSIRAKGQYIIKKGLRGVMFWEGSQDACGADSLIYLMGKALDRPDTKVLACPPSTQ